jgi:hypothetical protein
MSSIYAPNHPQIFCLAFLLAMGLQAKEIAARVEINQSTVYEWKYNLSFCLSVLIVALLVPSGKRGRGNFKQRPFL